MGPNWACKKTNNMIKKLYILEIVHLIFYQTMWLDQLKLMPIVTLKVQVSCCNLLCEIYWNMDFPWSVFSRIWTESYQYFPVQYDSVHIRENTDHRKSQVYNQNTNVFILIVPCLHAHQRKKNYNGQLALNSSIQSYHMAKYDVI